MVKYILNLKTIKEANVKSYAFALQKGGTGKTSISVSLAVELASKGKKVVYIDCDPQGNSSSWLLNSF